MRPRNFPMMLSVAGFVTLLTLVVCGCGTICAQAFGLPGVLMLNDIPIPPNADVRVMARYPIRMSGWLGLVNDEFYIAPQLAATVIDFYEQNLRNRGWSLLQKKQGFSADETCLFFTKFGTVVSV